MPSNDKLVRSSRENKLVCGSETDLYPTPLETVGVGIIRRAKKLSVTGLRFEWDFIDWSDALCST